MSVLEQLQIVAGRPCALVGEGDGGEVYAARELASVAASAGRKVRYVVAGQSEAPPQTRAGVETLVFGALGNADQKAFAKLCAGAGLLVLDGLRAAAGTPDPGACMRVLAGLERASRETSTAVVVLLGSHAAELHDGLGSVLLVKRGERKAHSRVHSVVQLQQPRGVFEGAQATSLVLEQREGEVLCRFDRAGLTAFERAELEADAELVMQCILDRPGSHAPAGGILDGNRAARAVAELVDAGRVSARGDRLVPDLYPTAFEVAKRASLDEHVFECIGRFPFITEAAIPERAKVAKEQLQGALGRLRRAGKIRSTQGETGESQYRVESAAAHDDAVARVRKELRECPQSANLLERTARLETAEAETIIAELLEAGELERDDGLDPCVFRLVTPARAKVLA